MVWEIVFYTLGILALVKGLVVFIGNKSIVAWALKLAKNKNSIRKMAILEIVLALILIGIGYLLRAR